MTTFLDSSARTEAPEKQYNFSFFAFMAALVLVFAASMAALVVSDYRRTVERAEQQLDHVADLFRQTVDASLSVANAKMQNTVEQLVQEPLGDRAAIAARFDDLLKDTVADIRQIDSLVLIDPQGEVAWSTTESLYGVNLADRSYFQKARQFGNGIYTIGVPILSRANGRRLTPIAWPLRAADGTLLGVVASSLGETYFSGLLTLNQLGEEMRVSITASNGEVAFVSEEVNATPRPMLSATKVISPIGLQIEASTSQAAALEPFWQRTVAVSLLASLLFLAAIAAAVSARTRSVELAGALRRSEHDRRRVEAAQKEFDTIFENVGDGIVLFDDGDTLIRSNLRARHLLGAETHEEAVARMRSLLPPLSRMDTATEVHRLSLPVPGSPDQEHALQCRVMKLHLHGEDIGYCVLEDISAQEQLIAARTAFITSVNHELRTPLTSLSGAIDLLQDRFSEALPAGAKKLISMAARNSDRLLVLVNDILTLQAIDQQRLNIVMEKVDVKRMLCEAVATNSGYGLGNGIRLVAEPPAEGEEAVFCADATRLQQVFSNLISNAIKYSPAGGEVTIGARIDAETITFSVRDAGPGIPKSAQPRIFDRFAKPLHNRQIQVSGTGLGLAITRELVIRQGGSIRFETRSIEDGEKPSGTTFLVSFPRKRDDCTEFQEVA